MSTNCTIGVEGMDIVVYKHHDGYPSATLKWLEDFNKSTRNHRDPQYKLAQLLRNSALVGKDYNLSMDNNYGWGIMPSKEFSGDAEWHYQLMDDGTVKYDSVNMGDNNEI